MIKDREAWLYQVKALCPGRHGQRVAIHAVVHWCLQAADDKRLIHLIDDARPELVARALAAGRWSGAELDALADALDSGGASLVDQYLMARSA